MINTGEAKNRGKQGRKAKIEQFAPPYFGKCWAHFDHFPKLISCILYLVSKLGKSGVHIFKWYSIWSWNEEVIAIWRRARTLWTEMLQPHPCWTHFGALPEAQIMHTISHFESWEVRSPMLQMVRDLELKRKSYGRLKTNAQSWAGISQPRSHLKGCFAAAKPPFGTRVPFRNPVHSFRSCEMVVNSSMP